jgi:dCMP deaminase
MEKFLREVAKAYSTDTKTQVGCGVMVEGQIIWGVNHLIKPIPQEDINNRTELYYSSIEHSEIHMCNKANSQGISLKGSTVYVSLFPCNKCAQRLIAEGVVKVVAYEDRPQADYIIKAKELFIANNVEFQIIED